jgi:abortive infection bacteriophage resistance protein
VSEFKKPSTTTQEQIMLLQSRGLIIHDADHAAHVLSHVSYYRFSAYTRFFYQDNFSTHFFKKDASFLKVFQIYNFDKDIRLFLLDAIGHVEISLRTQLANVLAHHHAAHGYLNPSVFDSRYNHSWLLDKLSIPINKNKNTEIFVQHYQKKYTQSPIQPPIWMAVECLTFSEVSRLFSHLRESKDTQKMENFYGIKYPVLKSWFRSLADLRNLCAHHARVWNREFGSFADIPKKPPVQWPVLPDFLENSHIRPQRRVYMQVLVIACLMRVICPKADWPSQFVAFLAQYPFVSLTDMGFPSNWQSFEIWQEKKI